MLETALLANPENLYKLQYFFFPSSSSEPIYARVTFALNEHYHQTCWTSSVLLKSLDPTVLTFLQIQFLNLLFELENPSTGFGNAELFFNLKVNSTESGYSRYINSTLQEFTSWVSTSECWVILGVLSYLQTEYLNVLFELEDPSNPSTGLTYNNVYLFFSLTVNSIQCPIILAT